MCLKGRSLEISAQPLVYARRSVLALPSADGKTFTVVSVIKGDTVAGEIITEHVFKALPADVRGGTVPLLLVRDDDWSWWANFGVVSADQTELLRRFAATKRTTEMNDAERAVHVAFFLPYLTNSEPMISTIAVEELSDAPQTALRTLKPRLDPTMLREALTESKGSIREALYTRLLKIAEGRDDSSK